MKKLIVVLGPTASGKTGLGIKLAKNLEGEIISADSRQVYLGMDIGSGKDLGDYGGVPYHLIDVAKPNEQFDLARYQRLAYEAIEKIFVNKKQPIVVGGSGLYLQAVCDGYVMPNVPTNRALREELEAKTVEELQELLKTANATFFAKLNNSDLNNKRRLGRYVELAVAKTEPTARVNRPRYDCLLIGLVWPKEVLDTRIKQRLMSRLDQEDMIGEVERLNNEGVTWQRLEKFGLEYKWIARYLQDKVEYDEMVEALYKDICHFAKRQMFWFKRWEKQDVKIHWIKTIDEADELVKNFLGDG
ncbi:tRNA (adenosine(37)-N6)-dimethylallyltransferase MiaA [Candidatus Falkowbacteria bacterium]|nr:tRNA (adenosine(37)-N6)-dimethylallyltransferase MiaA [Candidatus Falkowbacteria bacterium]